MIPIKIAAAMAVCLPLMVAIVSVKATALEVRPSEHGLEFQDPPPAGDKSSPEMLSFFGGSSSPTPDVALPLPKAMNSTDDAPGWWTRRDGGDQRLRNALLVATAACGITGVTLLVGSVLFYVFKVKNQRSLPLSSNNNNTHK